MEKSYKYLGYFFMLLIPITIAGFYRTYFGQFPVLDETIDAWIHIHAFISSVWILMIIIQPILISNMKFAIHRVIGRISYVIFPLLILSFLPQMIKMGNSGESEQLFFPIGASWLLIVFYSLAIFYRKSSPAHMRYMISGALVFLGPTMVRIGTILLGWSSMFSLTFQYILVYIILISLILYDRRNKKNYNPYLVSIACFAIHQSVYYLIFL